MSPPIQTFSDEINYLVWRYLRESSTLPSLVLSLLIVVDLAQAAWTLEAEVKNKSGKDIIALHEEVGKTLSVDLPKRLRMSLQYQEVLKHMSEVRLPPRPKLLLTSPSRTAIYRAQHRLRFSPTTNVTKATTHEYPSPTSSNDPGNLNPQTSPQASPSS
jgi:hypothetical protein